MKKYVIAGILVVAIAGYLIFTNSKSTPVAANTPSGGTNGTSSNGTPGTTTSTDMGGMVMGHYKDGTYTGPVTDAVYGKIQVAVTIANSMITSVDVPVYPTDGGHTQQVSATAIPTLKQEAIAAQSAQVDIVSGATQTSQGFMQSLASALAQAKA